MTRTDESQGRCGQVHIRNEYRIGAGGCLTSGKSQKLTCATD